MEDEFVKLNWIPFCSQTGGEVVDICNSLSIKPRKIVTNNYKKLSESTLKFVEEHKIVLIILPNKPSQEHYDALKISTFTLITLNGWLRIIPESFIRFRHSKIYNGHPGAIWLYPELKGLDPQEKAFKLKHSEVGSVVHKVVHKVDEGEIVEKELITIDPFSDINTYYTELKKTSLITWIRFFKMYFKL